MRHLLFAIVGMAISSCSCLAAGPVSIELQGQIKTECRLTAVAPTVDLVQMTKSGTRTVDFGLYCNAPFRYAVRSREGGLRNSGHTIVRAPFTALIPYVLRVSILTDAGGISDTCGSAQLTGGGSCAISDSGQGIAIAQTGSLAFSWSVPQELLAGDYADVVTLSLQPIF